MTHFSFTRTTYDECALLKKNQESTQPFQYMTDNTVVESNEACYLNVSPFQHNQFYSIPSANVDVESDLRGQTRMLSKCIEKKYNPETGLKYENKIKECADEKLVPQYTRINKPCNVFSGVTINRFHPLCEDIQSLNKIHSNSYIGSNTRINIKDTYKEKEKLTKPSGPLDLQGLCDANGQLLRCDKLYN